MKGTQTMPHGTAITLRVEDTLGIATSQDYTAKIDFLDIQKAVGGTFAVVPFLNQIEIDGKTEPCVAYCNENGIYSKLPLNAEATRLWRTVYPQAYDIVGPVLILIGTVGFRRS
jgi:hypothetical protein